MIDLITSILRSFLGLVTMPVGRTVFWDFFFTFNILRTISCSNRSIGLVSLNQAHMVAENIRIREGTESITMYNNVNAFGANDVCH